MRTDPAVRIGPPTPCPHCGNDNARLQQWSTEHCCDVPATVRNRVLCLVCARHWTEVEEQ